MRHRRRRRPDTGALLAGVTLVAVLAAGSLHGQEPEWILEAGGVLDLKLAHREAGRVDGGSLLLDRERRRLRWEGAPGEIGCRLELEAPFDDVDSVSADGAGFVVRLRNGKVRELRLIPVPHFAWLVKEPRIVSGAPPSAREAGLKGPDGDHVAFGGSGASTAPSVTTGEAPREVLEDSGRAVGRILAALDRPSTD